ncbi:MAG TPA: alpha/beta fold hydrolase [Allosphingosinicella sp.]|nr:alpha/beta fold hydrolase [Allosphingosinicella sp.]
MIKQLALIAGLIFASGAAAQQAPDPAELYGVRESVEHIDISPDGSHVVYLAAGPGRMTYVFVHDLAGNGTPRLIIRSDGNPERLRWCNFVTNERLICQVTGMIGGGTSILLPFSRLVSLDVSGANLTMLGQHDSFYDARVRQFDASIVDWLGGREDAVLMARDYVPEAGRVGTRMVRTLNGLGVDRVDVRTLRATPVEPPNAHAGSYISDGQGHVRIMEVPTVRTQSSGQVGNQIQYLYRTEGSRDWQSFGSFDSATNEGMLPLAVDPAINSAYVLRKLDGRFALYRVKLDGSMATELVYANPQVDVDSVVRANRGAHIIGMTFAEERRRIVYFDPAYGNLSAALGRAIPSLPLVDFGTDSADGNRILVHAGSDADAGRYYVYDRTARNLNEILMVRPQLEHAAPANVRSVTYPAPDGVNVPAYLTLPPGSTGRNLPAVILPHGGPAARDEWGFDWLAQYLAHQGYAVLQPNYRGSAGYGDQWLQRNGFRSWRTSIGDITAGARWLAAQGVADANRMAILGWSYGGYAALQAGVTEPGLFKAIVAIAPVTDLQQVKDDARHYTISSNVAEYIGSGPHIEEGSPLRHAAAIAAPVLLFHGDRDINVNVTHSRRMDSALRDAGKRSELTIFPGLEHDLADSQARVQMLRRIGVFLAAEMPAR